MSRFATRAVLGFFLLVPAGLPRATAQLKPQAAPAAADSSFKGGPFDRLKFRNIGPAGMSGRIDAIAVFERDPRIFYIGTATGGVWKTVNNGITLTPVFDSMAVSSIGDVAIPRDDPNLVWVGTGEGNNRQSSSWGDGVYKSTDGGRSWKNMGLKDSKQIAKIVIDPVDHEVVYVAALGDLWRSGGERGIYKTTDGGVSWSKVLDPGPDAGGTDLVMDPANNKVLYAAAYQRRRAGFGFNGGGPASGLYKSTDAGRSWSRLTKGIPEGPLGRIGIDIYRSNPNIVYTRIEHAKEGGVYRSDDAGFSWRKMGSHNGRPMYFGVIRVDPKNDLRVYSPETPLGVSDDGGKTFRFDGANRIHVDHHAMWIDPNNSDHMMIGNDGGVSITYDKGAKWMWLPNLVVGQFYHVGYDMQTPFNVCGGLQDNQSWCGPSQVRVGDGITDADWWTVPGGDGFVNLIDPTNARIIYTESQEGSLSRFDKLTGENKGIQPAAPSSEKPYRWNWDSPMLISPHDAATIYAGGNRLFKSPDRGHSWKAISPDLTTGVDRDTLELFGTKLKDVKIAKNDGVDNYATLFTIAESKQKPGLLYTGSDDGQLNVSKDEGATWTNVTSKIPNAPKWAYVSKVEPSKFDEATIYATFDAHRTGDYGTYVYASSDYGSSWKSIAANLPKGEVVRTITEDLKNADVLYLGTETGLWASLDRGKAWTRVRANLPTVPIYEITLHPRDNAMILATHGRAVWVLDELSPFQEATKAQAGEAHIFAAAPVYQRIPAGTRYYGSQGDMQFIGENPHFGAAITYWLKTTADSARIVIKDNAGNQVREIKGDAMKEGLAAGTSTIVWDLQIEPIPAVKKPGPAAPGGGGGFGFFGRREGGTPGPMVLPGDFRATLIMNGKEVASAPLTIQGDPDIQITDADRRRRYDLLKEGQQLQAKLAEAVDAVSTANKQLKDIKSQLPDSTKLSPAIKGTLDSLVKDLEPLKKKLGIRDEDDTSEFNFAEFRKILPFKLGAVVGNIGGAVAPPSENDLALWSEAKIEMPAAIDEINRFVARLRPFYRRLAEEGLYPPVPKPVEK
ncbi:MAG: glycosyl hydrolase [Gemmatimonadota bacterium]